MVYLNQMAPGSVGGTSRALTPTVYILSIYAANTAKLFQQGHRQNKKNVEYVLAACRINSTAAMCCLLHKKVS